MEKIIYLLSSTVEPAELRELLTGSIADEILICKEVHELEVYVSDQAGPLVDGLENNMNPLGLMSAGVSIWLRTLDGRGDIESALLKVAETIAGYSVTESVPREYTSRSWDDGVQSPTLTIGTAFAEKPGLDDEAFFERWHHSHTPLSLSIHPLTRYVRNTVSRVLTSDAPAYKAIVFESVESIEVLADIEQFYGGEANRKLAIADLCSFADLRTMSSMPMSETIVRSASWRRQAN